MSTAESGTSVAGTERDGAGFVDDPTARRRVVSRHLVTAGWVVSGAMLLSSATRRWVEQGPGSRFAGLELADNIRSGVLSPSWGVWVALALYSIIGLGGVFIATAVVDHPVVVIARGVVGLAGALVFVQIARAEIPFSEWAAGSTLAALSFFIATALTVVQLILRLGTRS